MEPVAVVIPTLNEAGTIGDVIREIPRDFAADIIIADSGSTDGTQAIAVAAGVQVARAAVTRVVPRISSFTLSFPIVFAAAIVVAIATLPLYAPLAAHPLLLVPYGASR